MESLKKTLKCLHRDLTRRQRRLILMMAVGFVSREQQVSCRIMRPLSPTRQRIWQRGRATGELPDILDRTQKDMGGKGDGDPEEKLKLKKIVSVMKGFGLAVAIDTSWPFRSESAAESTHYSGTPRQVNAAQKSMARR